MCVCVCVKSYICQFYAVSHLVLYSVQQPFTHESLLEDKLSEALTETEKDDAVKGVFPYGKNLCSLLALRYIEPFFVSIVISLYFMRS